MVSVANLILFILIVLVVYLAIKAYVGVRKVLWKNNHLAATKTRATSVGFFHPYCNAGGGGERVLWSAILALQKKFRSVHCVVYTGDKVSREEILQNVEQRFNIRLPREIDVVHLRHRYFVEAKYYPFCTLLMQSLGSIFLGLEALLKYSPDIYMDTMGYAFTLPLFRHLGGCRVGAYVHYPTISTDMLEVVRNREVALNNKEMYRNIGLAYLKLIYYKMFAHCYGMAGRQAKVIMVNSSWTQRHINEIWQKPDNTFVVYPPCDVTEFNKIPLEIHDDKKNVLSIAQFRPEKNHELQIRAFCRFLNYLPEGAHKPSLILVGSCRHEEDYGRVENLRRLCAELGMTENVEFRLNLTFQEVLEEMRNAGTGLHTMKDEHFGIGVVECMSAGLVMIAHDSGGPQMDIVHDHNIQRTGYLARDECEYTDALSCAWEQDVYTLRKIREWARHSTARFSTENFEKAFVAAYETF